MANKLTLKKATQALMDHCGNLSKAAEACDVSRRAFYAFVDKYPELEEVREEAKNILLDVAENNVTKDILRGEMKTTRWFLERMGKDRGYVTRVEETGKDGAPVQFEAVNRTVVDPQNEDVE